MCGTCLIEVEESGEGHLEPPTPDEAESLSIFAPGNPHARLACQIHICADLRIRKIQRP
jgi:2Fe-2S ferredoxin